MAHRLTRRHFAAFSATAIVGATGKTAFGNSQLVQQRTSVQDETAEKPPGPVEEAFERDYEPPSFKPSWKNEQINRQLVQDFVIYAHSDLAMVKKLLEKKPMLINSAMDWGAGDFETALGGASHMGQKEIVEYLLSQGARIDLFCAAMMGQIDAVRSFLTLQPELINAKGPHGFTLHFHAQVGGDDSKEVLDYLQSIKEVELRPIPFLQNRKKDAADK